jgi:hypothetical protein
MSTRSLSVPKFVDPFPAQQVHNAGGYCADAVSTDPCNLASTVFWTSDRTKNFKVYAIAGESGSGKSTLACCVIPRLLRADTTLYYSLTSEDEGRLAEIAQLDDPVLSHQRRILTCMYSSDDVNQMSGIPKNERYGERNEKAVDLLGFFFAQACLTSGIDQKAVARWLKNASRLKLNRTVFIVDEIGRGLPFASAIVSVIQRCLSALQFYSNEVHIVLCGTTADLVSRATHSSLSVTDPSVVHIIRVEPQPDRDRLLSFVRSRLMASLEDSTDVDEVMAQCKSPVFRALWSNPRLATQWVKHLLLHIISPEAAGATPESRETRSKPKTISGLCVGDARCAATHAARDYPYLNGLMSLRTEDREEVCDFAYVTLCRLFSPYRDNRFYWHLRCSGWSHHHASLFSSHFMSTKSEQYAKLRKWLLGIPPTDHALHFAFYFGMTKTCGLDATRPMQRDLLTKAEAAMSKLVNCNASELTLRTWLTEASVEVVHKDAAPVGEESCSAELCARFQQLMKAPSEFIDTPIGDLLAAVAIASPPRDPWELSARQPSFLYDCSMYEKRENELLDKCLRLGLLTRIEGSDAVEASPGLCLALCRDFGTSEAVPTDGLSFESIVAQAYLRRGRLERLTTCLFKLSEPMPHAFEPTGIDEGMASDIATFLQDGMNKMAVIVNGPSAKGPDLFVVTRRADQSSALIECVGIKHNSTPQGSWAQKMQTIGFDLGPLPDPPLRFVDCRSPITRGATACDDIPKTSSTAGASCASTQLPALVLSEKWVKQKASKPISDLVTDAHSKAQKTIASLKEHVKARTNIGYATSLEWDTALKLAEKAYKADTDVMTKQLTLRVTDTETSPATMTAPPSATANQELPPTAAAQARHWISHLAFGEVLNDVPGKAHPKARFKAVLHETAILNVASCDGGAREWAVYDRDSLGPWGVIVHRKEDAVAKLVGNRKKGPIGEPVEDDE